VASTIWGRPVSVHSTLTNPWNSDVSTAATIVVLRRLAHQYASDPSVRAVTAQALQALPPGSSQRDLAGAIFYWVRAHVRFIEDEQLLYEELGVAPANLDKELLIVPPVLLAMPQPMGDCDDFSLLTASMALAAGIRPYFVTVAADASDPRKFSHIYVCVHLADEDRYLCLDAGNLYPNIPPGWESDSVMRKAIWAV
jgi:hypothetical protein